MSFYKKYIAPYLLYLLLLLGFLAFEVGHDWLHYIDEHHHVHLHHHVHNEAKEHHHVHEHIQELLVTVVPSQLKKQQSEGTFSAQKQIIKQTLFFCTTQTAYTFSYPKYQPKSISVILPIATPPPKA